MTSAAPEEKPYGSEESLPFSNPKQEALMGHLLADPKFFLLARNKIEVSWWGVMRLQQLWGILTRLAAGYDRAVTAAELSECQEMVALDVADANRLRSLINLCLQRRLEFGLDMLQDDLTDWLRCRIYLNNMKKSEALFNMAAKGGGKNKDRLSVAFAAVKKMSQDIEDATFEYEQVETITIEDIENAKIDAKHAVDFGLPRLNALLNPEGLSADDLLLDPNAVNLNGLLKGDMTVLLAPTNVGKTTTMVTIAAVNILSGRDVLLITHEGRISDIKLKIWQCMMEDTRSKLIGGLANPQYRALLLETQALMARHLQFMPMNKAGLAVEDVEVAIRRRQEKWQSTHQGKGFDLIIDDYAAKLTTNQARGGNFQLRQIHEVVYNYFSQIALEHNAHVVTAIQTNREGSKVNSRQHKGAETRFLTMEDVMESWGPMTTATNVISINRPPEAQSRNVTGFYVCKSRSSEVGVVFLAKSNFGCARSHWPTWDCEEYRLSAVGGDRVEKLLEDFQGVHLGDAQADLPGVVPAAAAATA